MVYPSGKRLRFTAIKSKLTASEKAFDQQQIPNATLDQGHGRVGTRECWVLSDLEILDERGPWRDLNAVVRFQGTREVNGVLSVEDRFFITSLPTEAERVMRAVRFYWGIERE